ncbi:MAG: GAF domain-containing protein [Ktedonobacteraceae bacterium]|nr:GAF domain-containing protein [Ktedonobacteraceae bacterium]
MQHAFTWRDLLGQIISDPGEKQRLIDELGISAVTLGRWVSGESEPRPQNLRLLISALPQYRENMLRLLGTEKGLAEVSISERSIPKEIPSDFYVRVLQARASTTENLRFWTLSNMILQQALTLLDSENGGVAVWIVRCMPPSGPHHKVRSLRETIGFGSSPWPRNLEQHGIFLGAESLAGMVATSCRASIIQDLDAVGHHFVPIRRDENENSSAIFPILYAGRVAGVLMVQSAHKNYFASPALVELIQRYAELCLLAFEPEDFYRPDQLSLVVMPSLKAQRRCFLRFPQFLAEALELADSRHLPVDLQAWQRIEEDLLQVALAEERNSREQ